MINSNDLKARDSNNNNKFSKILNNIQLLESWPLYERENIILLQPVYIALFPQRSIGGSGFFSNNFATGHFVKKSSAYKLQSSIKSLIQYLRICEIFGFLTSNQIMYNFFRQKSVSGVACLPKSRLLPIFCKIKRNNCFPNIKTNNAKNFPIKKYY